MSDGKVIWEEEFTDEQKKIIMDRIKMIKEDPSVLLTIEEFEDLMKAKKIIPESKKLCWQCGYPLYHCICDTF